MDRIRAEERGSSLGLVSGKLNKEEEKVAEGLFKKICGNRLFGGNMRVFISL